MHEMAAYPMISELRSMLERWNSAVPNAVWNGHSFFGYTSALSELEPRIWIRCEGRTTFGFSNAEWATVKDCFRRAWEMPELQRVWNELSMEYGEL
jgi:hypothetical protein